MSLVQHVKARTRSVQLDKRVPQDWPTKAPTGFPETAPRLPNRSKRTYSLPPGRCSEEITELDRSMALKIEHQNIRRFRSMLEVEEPPMLGPWKPMCFDDIYFSSLQRVEPPPPSPCPMDMNSEPPPEIQETTDPFLDQTC
jgi:hypothetical protein